MPYSLTWQAFQMITPLSQYTGTTSCHFEHQKHHDQITENKTGKARQTKTNHMVRVKIPHQRLGDSHAPPMAGDQPRPKSTRPLPQYKVREYRK